MLYSRNSQWERAYRILLRPSFQRQNSWDTEAIRILVAISQAVHVCLGVEGTSELRAKFSTSTDGLIYSQLLERIAPKMRVRLTGDVVDISAPDHAACKWLDTPLLLQTEKPEDINWIADGLLAGQLYYRARPGLKGGIAGDIGGAGVNVGPYPKQFRPARDWLTQLIHDSGGGCWPTPSVWCKRELPPMNPWLILLYSTSPEVNNHVLVESASRSLRS
jgi:hypothetical protein